jgi:drug/metabolite transporter (DMT)-like permease
VNPLRINAIGTLYVLGFLLGFVGVVFLVMAAQQHQPAAVPQIATPGYVCLGIAAVFVLTASILAFIAGGPDRNRQDRGEAGERPVSH